MLGIVAKVADQNGRINQVRIAIPPRSSRRKCKCSTAAIWVAIPAVIKVRRLRVLRQMYPGVNQPSADPLFARRINEAEKEDNTALAAELTEERLGFREGMNNIWDRLIDALDDDDEFDMQDMLKLSGFEEDSGDKGGKGDSGKGYGKGKSGGKGKGTPLHHLASHLQCEPRFPCHEIGKCH